MATDFGTTISVSFDLSSSIFSLKTGLACLAQDCLNRLSTDRGSLFYDEDYGLDVRIYLNKRAIQGTPFRASAEIASELKKDPRIESVKASVSFSSSGEGKITLELTTLAGPFLLVLSATPEIVKIAKVEAR